MRRLPLISAALLFTACFSPEAPIESEGTEGGAEDSSSGAGPTSGPGAVTGTTGEPGETDPSGPTASDTEDPKSSDTDPTGTDPTDTDSSDTDPTTTGDAQCGDGEVEGDEVCDDGVNDGSYGGCAEDCSALGPRCGDGEENGTEDCDDGDEVQGNGCNNDCIPSGLELWTHEEHVTPNDECVALSINDADEVYLAARIDNLDGGEFAGSIYAQRLSDTGSVDWEREHAPLATSSSHDYRTYSAVATDDGVVIAGAHRLNATSNPLLSSYTDVHTVKLSAANGDVTWTRTDTDPHFPFGIAVDDAGELAVAAVTTSDLDSYIFRISADGDAVGTPSFTAGGAASAISFDPAGSWLVGMSPDETVIQRRNAGLGVLWEAEVLIGFEVRGLVAAAGGDIFVVGPAGVARHADNTGMEVWTVMSSDVAALGEPYAIAATPEGDIVVAGGRQGAPWLSRLDPTGAVMWSRSAGEAGDFAAVDVRGDGVVIACGTVDGGGQGSNVFVAAYTP